MKSANRFIGLSILLLFTLLSEFASAQTGPFPFTGDDNVCQNQTKSYGVTNVAGSTYTWTITPGTKGVDWDSTSSGNIITIHWLKPGTYVLSVTETNANGCASNPVPINIVVNPLLTATRNITVCANQLPYTWLGHVFSGAGTVKDTVSGNNSCDTIRTLILAVNPILDPVITGPSPVCESINGSTETYSTPQVGCNTYSWSVSAGGTIIGSNTGNSIVVKWTTPGTKTVTVTETMCSTGCSKTVNKDFIVTPRPATTPITHN